jgi:hypothetical protein
VIGVGKAPMHSGTISRTKGRAELGEQTFGQGVVFVRQGASRGRLQAASYGMEEVEQVIQRLTRGPAYHTPTGHR